MPHDTPSVVEALSKLSGDTDRDVRDWATFTLGSQFESDSPILRQALHDRLADEVPDVRGEALVGLARRRDPRIAAEVLRELEGKFHGDRAIESAGIPGDSMFLPALKALEQRLTDGTDAHFHGSLQAAIAACERRLLDNSTLQ
jgi:hypothetical protein